MDVETVAYVDESRFERIDGQLVSRPVPGFIHAKIQKKLVLLLDKRIAAEVLPEWSLVRPETVDTSGSDFLTPDVTVASRPYQVSKNGHLIPPALLAIEIVSPGQDDQFKKAQMLFAWGVENVWIINPSSQDCFEYHGGDSFIKTTTELRAGPLIVPTADIFS